MFDVLAGVVNIGAFTMIGNTKATTIYDDD
jgi:hypothetical protein